MARIGVRWQGRGSIANALRRVIAFLPGEVQVSSIVAQHEPPGRLNSRGMADARDDAAKDNRKE